MKLIDRIKMIFVKNKISTNNENSNIVLFDVNDINIPSFNSLKDEEKEKVIKYKQQIDINNLEQVIKYNQDISIEGENIANLFIKYLYELNEITNKYGKTIDELNEDSVNLAIKNVKLIVLKEKLEELLHNTYLKTIAIHTLNNEYKNRNHKFIELFSHAARIKRNSQLKSIEELEIRSKIIIKTLEQQLIAMYNAISNNNTTINQIDIYNNLTNNVDNKEIRKKIYKKKIDFYKKANHYLNDIKLPVRELDLSFSNNKDEMTIMKLIAVIELKIDKYKLESKNEFEIDFYDGLNDFESSLKNTLTKDTKNEILEKINHLYIVSQIFKEYIKDDDIERLYRLKFQVLTVNINSLKEKIIPETKEELDVYKKIISEKLALIQKSFSSKLLKILKKYFYNDGYDCERILNNNFLLALLLSFDSNYRLRKFFKEYKFDHMTCHDIVDLHENFFDWDSELSLETICRIMQVEKKISNRKEFPPFFELYNFCNNHIEEFNKHELYKYVLPSGINSIEYNFSGIIDSLIYEIRKNSSGKTIVFPSPLWYLSGDIFGNISIKDIKLNDGITYIGPVVFANQILKEITFPSSLESIECNSFNYKEIEKLTFLDFKNSKLLYNLLYSEEDKYKQVLFNLFTCSYHHKVGVLVSPYIKSLYLHENIFKVFIISDKDLEFKDMNDKREISLSIDDIPYIREHLIKVIREKTGFDFKEYHEEKILKK